MTLPNQIDSGDGRTLQLQEASPADMLDLIEAAGVAAGSTAWMRYALMICSVRAIDGKPIMMPNTKEGIRELGRRIGNAGMDAVAQAHYPEEDATEPAIQSEIDMAKN